VNTAPVNLLEIVEIIGEAAALKLVNSFGGQTVRIPALRNANSEHALAQCIGIEALTALAKADGGRWLYVAKCERGLRQQRNVEIVKHYSDGMKVESLVQRYGLSDRQIWNILGSTVVDDRQCGLF
jgi:Mor family transcriptional regulator